MLDDLDKKELIQIIQKLEKENNELKEKLYGKIEEKEVETVPEESGSEVDVTDTINKIRQMALQAIAKLADNPTSKQYDIMKRIWNICDKSFDNKNNETNNSGE